MTQPTGKMTHNLMFMDQAGIIGALDKNEGKSVHITNKVNNQYVRFKHIGKLHTLI